MSEKLVQVFELIVSDTEPAKGIPTELHHSYASLWVNLIFVDMIGSIFFHIVAVLLSRTMWLLPTERGNKTDWVKTV